jgi:hypothetical protein
MRELKDMYGRKISVGDFVVHPTTSRDTGLRTSIVTKLNASRNVIHVKGCRVKDVYSPSARVLIVDAESLPEDEYFRLTEQQ